jgi:UDP-2,4-diacetamido-2,4,6-trideoxy-beta-L-altropyranose hydrolase
VNVFIITEGSSYIGFGHVTRCISLSDAFQEKNITPTFIVNGDDVILSFLEDKNQVIFDWVSDKERLFSIINKSDIVVVDSYLADVTFYNQVSKIVNTPVYIDDTIRIDYPQGIVVNGTIYAEELSYPKREDVTYLLGSQYIPLRKEFWNVPNKDIRESIKTIMMTFGGDDVRNMTPKVLDLLKESFPGLIKKVVIGKGFRNNDQIESLQDLKTELIYYPDAEKMKKLMLESDIAISAAGQTLYELARIGVPTIAIGVSENQTINVRAWQKSGVIEHAGWWDNTGIKDKLKESIEKVAHYSIRKENSDKGRLLIDGVGSLRIINYLLRVADNHSSVNER